MSDRFQASIACAHRSVLTDVMERAPRGGGAVTISAHEDAMLRDLAGALNYWAVQPGGCGPVVPPPIVTPPPNTAVRLHDAIQKGDYSRKLFTAEAGVVDVFPFVVPGPPYAPKGPLLYASVSEFGGQPVMRITTISRTPGDLNPTTSINWSRGKETLVSMLAGIDAPVGTQLYINTIMDEPPPSNTASGVSIVWSEPVE